MNMICDCDYIVVILMIMSGRCLRVVMFILVVIVTMSGVLGWNQARDDDLRYVRDGARVAYYLHSCSIM